MRGKRTTWKETDMTTAALAQFINEYEISSETHIVEVFDDVDWEPEHGEFQNFIVTVMDWDDAASVMPGFSVGDLSYSHSSREEAWKTAHWLAKELGGLEVQEG